MGAVVLKGRKDGYELILKADASIESIIVELKELLDNLQRDENLKKDTQFTFQLNTGMRLLSSEEKKQFEKLFSEYSHFSIYKTVSDVVNRQDAYDFMDKHNVHVNAATIRNGQVVTITGDVLFLGYVHQGGILRVTGNIYILGDVAGIVHAGFEDNSTAIIAGKIGNAQQVRIGDLVDIMEEIDIAMPDHTVVYVNDLHKLSYTKVDELKSIRPKLFVGVGGF